MAQQVFAFGVAVPASTLQASPQVTELAMPPRVIDQVDIRFPNGLANLVGVQLASGQGVVIPYNSDQFLISNAETLPFPLEDYPTSGSWQLRAYNTDTLVHTVYLRFLTSLPVPVPPAFVAPVLIYPGAA